MREDRERDNPRLRRGPAKLAGAEASAWSPGEDSLLHLGCDWKCGGSPPEIRWATAGSPAAPCGMSRRPGDIVRPVSSHISPPRVGNRCACLNCVLPSCGAANAEAIFSNVFRILSVWPGKRHAIQTCANGFSPSAAVRVSRPIMDGNAPTEPLAAGAGRGGPDASHSCGTTLSDSSRSCSFVGSDGASIIRSSARWFIGNMMTSRMFDSSASSMTMRSTPSAQPPCGGAP